MTKFIEDDVLYVCTVQCVQCGCEATVFSR